MNERVKQLESSRIVQIAGGVLLGLAAWHLVEGLVNWLLIPLIAILIGDFETMSFTISGSDFPYGFLLATLLVVAGAVLLLAVAFPTLRDQILGRSSRGDSRCPECQEPIASEARRCPHCTVVLVGDAS